MSQLSAALLFMRHYTPPIVLSPSFCAPLSISNQNRTACVVCTVVSKTKWINCESQPGRPKYVGRVPRKRVTLVVRPAFCIIGSRRRTEESHSAKAGRSHLPLLIFAPARRKIEEEMLFEGVQYRWRLRCFGKTSGGQALVSREG